MSAREVRTVLAAQAAERAAVSSHVRGDDRMARALSAARQAVWHRTRWGIDARYYELRRSVDDIAPSLAVASALMEQARREST